MANFEKPIQPQTLPTEFRDVKTKFLALDAAVNSIFFFFLHCERITNVTHRQADRPLFVAGFFFMFVCLFVLFCFWVVVVVAVVVYLLK